MSETTTEALTTVIVALSQKIVERDERISDLEYAVASAEADRDEWRRVAAETENKAEGRNEKIIELKKTLEQRCEELGSYKEWAKNHVGGFTFDQNTGQYVFLPSTGNGRQPDLIDNAGDRWWYRKGYVAGYHEHLPTRADVERDYGPVREATDDD